MTHPIASASSACPSSRLELSSLAPYRCDERLLLLLPLLLPHTVSPPP